MDPEPALRVERHTAEWFRAQKIVPGAEVHDDPDVVWIVQPGSAWGNAGVMVRLSESSGADRLDALVERYRRNGLGMGVWVSPHATPTGLTSWLQERRLHCRKHFPAMMRTTSGRVAPRRVPGLKCHVIDDPSEFLATPHPSIGPITTPKRRYALTRLSALIAHRPQTTWGFIASLEGQAVGSSLLFLGSDCAGLHDLTVLEDHRGRGIGSALLEYTWRTAVDLGASSMALLATSDGQRVYERCGFDEVARLGYWYRSFQR
jgi:GNAT superfamily N-acetyltransferase